MTDSGTILRALLDSLWWENSLLGKVIISCILFLLLRAVLEARRHLLRYRNEGAAVTVSVCGKPPVLSAASDGGVTVTHGAVPNKMLTLPPP